MIAMNKVTNSIAQNGAHTSHAFLVVLAALLRTDKFS